MSISAIPSFLIATVNKLLRAPERWARKLSFCHGGNVAQSAGDGDRSIKDEWADLLCGSDAEDVRPPTRFQYIRAERGKDLRGATITGYYWDWEAPVITRIDSPKPDDTAC